MYVQEHAGAAFLIIILGELEDKCFLRVTVLRDMLEVKRGILSLCCLNEKFFFGENQDEGRLDIAVQPATLRLDKYYTNAANVKSVHSSISFHLLLLLQSS